MVEEWLKIPYIVLHSVKVDLQGIQQETEVRIIANDKKYFIHTIFEEDPCPFILCSIGNTIQRVHE